MELFARCHSCKERKLYIKHWWIKIPHVSVPVLSKSKLCRACITQIKKVK